MTPSRSIRLLFLGSMLGSIVLVLAWSRFLAWRKWPEWRAVREMRAAVEADEPARFLDAVEAVDSIGVAEDAAHEMDTLCHHPSPRVRMYAVMALTVLGPRGPTEAKQLIELFDDPNEVVDVRCVAASCLVLFGQQAREALPSLEEAIGNRNDPRYWFAIHARSQLGAEVTGPSPISPFLTDCNVPCCRGPDPSREQMAEFLVSVADNPRWTIKLLKSLCEIYSESVTSVVE